MLNFTFKDADKVRIAIGEQGKSIREFARSIEISQAYMSQILSGKRNPSPKVANKIAKGLKTNVESIFFIQIDNKRYIR